ncbi:acyltransferase family protein [Dietzia alimentaria]|uniref:acyltransferase family protein n=1 Tax=Dietzia alimentaria TaxID=665550 RepID=UPI00029AFF9F|nr:acyltransferase family protein [Dietzia alimentaria]
MRRSAPIDGIRALAVIAVILYHFFPASFPGGFLGVDVFFVLSGFLITSLLLRERATTGRISLAAFWKRRARRILPAGFTLAAFFASLTLLADPDLRVGLWKQLLGILTFSTNWVEILDSGSYFEQTTPRIFVHYWSLAVEEQFYLFWPLIVTGLVALVALVGTRRGIASASGVRKIVGVVAATGALASGLLMAVRYVPGEDPSRLYYGTDTHAFGLLIGAAVAALVATTSTSRLADLWPTWRLSEHQRRVEDGAAGVALVALLGAVLFLSDRSDLAYRGGIALACATAAVVVVAAARGSGPVALGLGHPALSWIGLRSYSLYLVHWPVFVLVDSAIVDPAVRASGLVPVTALVLTVTLAAASYRWIETPFLHARAPRVTTPSRSPQRIALAVVAVTVLASGSTAAALTAPVKSSVQVQLEAAARAQQEAALAPPPPPHREMPPGEAVSVIGDSVALGASPSFLVTFPGMAPTQIDAEVSRSWMAVPSIIAARQQSGLIGEAVVLGIGANGPAGAEYVLEAIDALGPDVLVVVVNAHSPLPNKESINAGIMEAVAARPNAELADWDSAAALHPDYLAADGVHPADARGTDLYATVAHAALERLVERTPAAPAGAVPPAP